MLFLEIVIVDFDGEDSQTTHGRNEVRDEQGPKDFRPMEYALKHEADATDACHEESWQCDAFGLPGPYGLNSLRHISQDERNAGHPATNVINR